MYFREYIHFPTKMFLFLIICCLPSLSSAKQYDAYIDRTERIKMNPEYVSNWNVYTHRPNRNSPYTFTANFTFLRPLYNNITIHIIAYEKLSTEYKESFIFFKGGVCTWLKKEVLIAPLLHTFSKTPLTCPIVGNILIQDLRVKSENLPSYMPGKNLRLDFHFYITATKETILLANMYIMIVEKARKMKPSSKTTTTVTTPQSG